VGEGLGVEEAVGEGDVEGVGVSVGLSVGVKEGLGVGEGLSVGVGISWVGNGGLHVALAVGVAVEVGLGVGDVGDGVADGHAKPPRYMFRTITIPIATRITLRHIIALSCRECLKKKLCMFITPIPAGMISIFY
jgi:hypothetical protein